MVQRIPSAKHPSTRFANINDQKRYSDAGQEEEEEPSSSLAPAIKRQPSDGLEGVKVSTQERGEILRAIQEGDEDNEPKTFSRKLVEDVLSKYDWYWPRRNDKRKDKPTLSKAWKYYEEVTLPRHVSEGVYADDLMRKAEPGDITKKTELYDPCGMPQSSFIEWGTGMDLYFISLKFFAAAMLFLGILNSWAIYYYASDAYNDSDLTVSGFVRGPILRGSAICTDTQWVVCTDCNETNWKEDPKRYAYNNVNNVTTIFVKRNLCGGVEDNGWANYVTLLVVVVMVVVFSKYLELREIRYDEDKVTTTDYSVMVTNPPPDAIDPDKWKNFFNQFATGGDQVTAVTVALNNEELVQKLVNRRIFREELRAKLPRGTNIDDDDIMEAAVDKYLEEQSQIEVGCLGKIAAKTVIPILNIFNMLLPADKLKAKVGTLYDEIEELQKKEYHASKIFVTFETEEGQRAALDALKVGQLNLLMNNTSAVSSSFLFDGKTILHVVEPGEPNAIRWHQLSKGGLIIKKYISMIVTMAINIALISLAGFLIKLTRRALGPFWSGMLTTGFNSTVPQVIKILMAIFEPHTTEGDFQASLYLKITVFRWTLSAILTSIITPHTATLGNQTTDMIPTIYGILLSDVWLSPLLKLSDWMTAIKKHIIAPRASTQREMNSWFQGTYYHLGERYTDFTKVVFVVFVYSALFPVGFFFGFLILTIQYFVDKFSLVRIWCWQPSIGSEIAIYSRRYFFTGATVAFAAMSSLVWAQFPYDNLCDPLNGTAVSVMTGNYTGVRNLDGLLVKGLNDDCSDGMIVDGCGVVNVEQDYASVECLQNWRDYIGFPFPAGPRYQTDSPKWINRPNSTDLQWMDEPQTYLTLTYGWTALLIGFAFLAGMFGKSIYLWLKSFFFGVYESNGADQHIDFSSSPDIFAYVPQIKRIGYPFAFLVCDIDDIDQGLIGWNDPNRSYDYYNLIFDIPHPSLRREKMIEGNTRVDGVTTLADHDDYEKSRSHGRPIYSIIAQYPTKWQVELIAKEKVEAKSKKSSEKIKRS